MKMYLDTSTSTTTLRLDDREYTWESGRDLAEGLLEFLRDKLAENGANFQDLTEIVFFAGPGSFTGLRIGAAVVNTLSHELKIPLFKATSNFQKGEQVPIILPDYGRPANISQPRK